MTTRGFAARLVGVPLALFTLAGPVLAEDLDFTLDNESSADLVQFFTSPTDVNDWEEDVLGDGILAAGYSVVVTIADGRSQCIYDLRFVFADGSDFVDTANLCDTGYYTLVDQ